MTHRVAAIAAALLVVVAGCGGSESSCADIATDAVNMVQDVVDDVDAMSQDDLASLGTSGLFDEFTVEAAALDERAAGAGCSDQDMTELVTEKAQDLTAETEFGQLFIDSIRSGQIFEG